jgi:uncharacterized protein YegL
MAYGEPATAYDADTVRETTAVSGQVIMPFYLLVDVSYSMKSDEQELTSAISELISEISNDPVVDDLVMLSIITFNHAAQTIVPLGNPSELQLPPITTSGGTDYGKAFTEYHRAFLQDRDQLKNKGMKVYRPCVFFLTDGAPQDQDYLTTFQNLFAYDSQSRTGNKAFPYFVPYGFRQAPETVIRSLAYPNFGLTKGRWFLSSSTSARDALRALTDIIGRTVISSGMSVPTGNPQIVPPEPASGGPAAATPQFGDAEDWV